MKQFELLQNTYFLHLQTEQQEAQVWESHLQNQQEHSRSMPDHCHNWVLIPSQE